MVVVLPLGHTAAAESGKHRREVYMGVVHIGMGMGMGLHGPMPVHVGVIATAVASPCTGRYLGPNILVQAHHRRA